MEPIACLSGFLCAGQLQEVPMYDFLDTTRTVVASLLLTLIASAAFVGGSVLLSVLGGL